MVQSEKDRAWTKITKEESLDLFAFWLPDEQLPDTKRDAIAMFAKKNWIYNQDEVKTALDTYSKWQEEEGEKPVLVAREIKEKEPLEKDLQRRKRRRTEETSSERKDGDDDDDDFDEKAGEKSNPNPETVLVRLDEMKSLRDQVQRLTLRMEQSDAGPPEAMDMHEDLRGEFPDSLLKCKKLTNGEKKRLVRQMPKYSSLPKVIDKTEGECLLKIKNSKVKAILTVTGPLAQRQHLQVLNLGMYARGLMRDNFIDADALNEVDRVLVAITTLACDNALGAMAHMRRVLLEELGLTEATLNRDVKDEFLFGEKELKVVDMNAKFDQQLRFRQNKNKPDNGFRPSYRGGRNRGRGRGRGGRGGQQFNPYKRNSFYSSSNNNNYNNNNNNNNSYRGGRGSYGRGSFGNKTGKYNKDFNPRNGVNNQ
jgi:hypothetical protein